jgi:thiopeptide-type bacteriocin biosynthesis protein
MRNGLIAGSFFVVRTPSLPWSTVTSLLADPRAPASNTLIERILSVAEDPFVAEAIYLASPSLHRRVQGLRAGAATGNALGNDVAFAFFRYLQRMSFRATPFGLFSGVSLGTVRDGPSEVQLSSLSENRRHARVDMSLLLSVLEPLASWPGESTAWEGQRTYRANPSLYKWADTWRYAEMRTVRGEVGYDLSALRDVSAISLVIEAASNGAVIDSLRDALVEREGVEREEAQVFLRELVAAQVLLPALQPCITGESATRSAIRQLRSWPGEAAAAAAEGLRRADQALADVRSPRHAVAPDVYETMVAELEAATGVEAEPGRAIQMDLERPAVVANLHPRVVAEIAAGAELLRVVDRRFPSGLTEFLARFEQRYENAAVPLMEVLDEEAGLGFEVARSPRTDPSPLLADLPFPAAPESISWTPAYHGRLQNWILSAARDRRIEVELTDGDIDGLKAPHARPFPRGFCVLASIAAESPAHTARGDFRVWVQSVAGPNGGVFLARFCDTLEPLENRLREHLQAETSGERDAIHAEIVHLAYGRLGNVVTRPHLREYELPFLGGSGAPGAQCIDVRDLLLEVTEGEPVLWSKEHGRRVVPHLTNAHAFAAKGNVGLYRFLCAIQDASATSGARWDWGPLESSAFLPRLRKGRIVLSLARWRLFRDDLEALGALTTPQRFARVQSLRESLGWPRYMRVVEGDNALPLDLDNPVSVEAAWVTMNNRTTVALSEIFPEREELLWATGPEGRFHSEVVVPFAHPRPDAERAKPIHLHESCRRFMPGSEWLFLKVYMGVSAADRVMAEEVAALVETLRAEAGPFSWFVVRYGDPEWHLRIRVRVADEARRGRARAEMEAWAQRLAAAGFVWRVQFDTYTPELARYGGSDGVRCAEAIFEADSAAATALVAATLGDHEARWQVCLLAIDRLLDDLGCSLVDKERIMQEGRRRFSAEFRAERGLSVRIGAQFRRDCQRIDAVLGAPARAFAAGDAIVESLEARSASIRALPLVFPPSEGAIAVSMDEFALSVVHMCANRLLQTSRAVELVTYDYLWRVHRGRLARERAKVPRVAS